MLGALRRLLWWLFGRYERRLGLLYATPSGVPLHADVWIPPGPGPFPAVLLVHGGGWYSGKPWHMSSIAARLCMRGLVAVNVAYRLAPDHLYPAAVEDVRAALRWLRAESAALKIDPARVGGWGYSAGAHLVGLIAYDRRPGEELSAVALGAVPADLRRYARSPIVTRFIGKPLAEAREAYHQASLNPYVGPHCPPSYLYHGRWDLLVRPSQSIDLAAELRRAGVETELRLVPCAAHLSLFLVRPAEADRAAAYLKERLTRPDGARTGATR